MDLTAEQFAELVHSLDLNTDTRFREKRRAPRIGHHGTLDITLCPAPPANTPNPQPSNRLHVSVVNISSRGICINYSLPLPAGQQFIIHLRGQNQRHVHILCTVVHSHPIGSHHKIGAEFTCVIPSEAAAQAAYEATQSQRIQQSILD